MKEENKESKQEVVEETTNQTAPTDETKTEEKKADTPESPEEEKVTLTKKELEDLKKRADDNNRSIELKRLKKLEERGVIKTDVSDDVKDEITKLREELSAFKTQSFNTNLSEAYREFVKENPWANDDSKFDKIKENFNSVGTESKEELFSKLKSAAQGAFPEDYERHLEEKLKAKILSSKTIDNSNGGASSAEILHKDTNQKSPEEKMKEKMAALFKKSIPSGR